MSSAPPREAIGRAPPPSDLGSSDLGAQAARVVPIKIVMQLNVPGAPEAGTPLTRALLRKPLEDAGVQPKSALDPSSYADLPFFSPNRLYPMHEIAEYGFDMRVRFFFHKATFTRLVSRKIGAQECAGESPEFGADEHAELRIANCNIRFMLAMLFPTAAPSAANNNVGSFEQYISGEPRQSASMRTLFVPRRSYLDIGGKTQTAMRTVWLNDFVNHPVYKALVDDYSEFELWKKDQTAALVRESAALNNTIESIITKESAEADIAVFNKGADSLISSTRTGTNVLRTSSIDINAEIEALQTAILAVFGYSLSADKTTIVPIGFRAPAVSQGDDTDIVGGVSATEKFNVQTAIDGIDEISTRVKYIITAVPSYSIPGQLGIKVDKLTRAVAAIRVSQNLKKTYFGNKTVADPNFTEDTGLPEAVRSADGNYKEYVMFVKKIRDFVQPVRMTTNVGLQKMIDDFAGNIAPDFGNYIKHVRDKFFLVGGSQNIPHVTAVVEKYPTYFPSAVDADPKQHLFVGACRVRDGDAQIYEIYVRVDVVGGEITSKNTGALDCGYKGDRIGHTAMTLLNTPDNANGGRLQPYTFYYDILQGSGSAPANPELSQKTGGRSRTARRPRVNVLSRHSKIHKSIGGSRASRKSRPRTRRHRRKRGPMCRV